MFQNLSLMYFPALHHVDGGAGSCLLWSSHVRKNEIYLNHFNGM